MATSRIVNRSIKALSQGLDFSLTWYLGRAIFASVVIVSHFIQLANGFWPRSSPFHFQLTPDAIPIVFSIFCVLDLPPLFGHLGTPSLTRIAESSLGMLKYDMMLLTHCLSATTLSMDIILAFVRIIKSLFMCSGTHEASNARVMAEWAGTIALCLILVFCAIIMALIPWASSCSHRLFRSEAIRISKRIPNTTGMFVVTCLQAPTS